MSKDAGTGAVSGSEGEREVTIAQELVLPPFKIRGVRARVYKQMLREMSFYCGYSLAQEGV